MVSNLRDIDIPHSNNSRFQVVSWAIVWQILVTVVALIPDSAQAQHRLSEDCPPAFSIVDIGTWGSDEAGYLTRLLGGTLVNIGQQDKAQPDTDNAWVSCYPSDHASEPTLNENGNPIPLVSHVVFPSGLGFAQYENTKSTIERLDHLFQNSFPELPVSEVNLGNGLGTGLCKLGRENDRRAVFRDYACLISMDHEGKQELFFYCQAYPHSCAYYVSLGEGVMVYQQPSDYAFTRAANTLEDAARAWVDFAVSGQANIEERRIARD